MKNSIGFTLILFFLLSCSAAASNKDKQLTDSPETFALIVGALEWTDPLLPSFEKKNRKDKELYELLKATGTKEENILFLMDSEATLKNITYNLNSILIKTKENSHFIFYYAGHGMHEDNKYYFANYDIETKNPSKTGLNLEMIADAVIKNFKGNRVTLWADCCYSGGLAGIAEKISKKGIQCCALTSATATNTSTGNWTYSQTLIDCLKGDALMDNNSDGKITLNEMASQIKDAMKYRERQLNTYNLFNMDGDKTIISTTDGKKDLISEETGSYFFALNNGKWEVARVTGKTNNKYNCEFYFYSDKETKLLTAKEIKRPYFVSHTIGSKIKVEYEGKYYDATIQKSDGDFYYITYNNYDKSYDEWVLYDRIRTGNEKTKEVLWEGKYYNAEILETKDNKCYVHYIGYDYSWDEWTDLKNIK